MNFTKIFIFVCFCSLASFAAVDTVYDASINANDKVTWKTGDTLILKGQVWVEAGARLDIQPGVVIKAERVSGKNHSSLIICKGARIYAIGTRTQPIIFTSIDDDFNPVNGVIDPSNESSTKMWGGLVLLGNAPVCGGPNLAFEGITATDPRNSFGGNDPHDTSGVLMYVSLRYGGAEYDLSKEINQVTFCGVGDGTVVDYVESFNSGDDAFEWFGGTVNSKHLIAYNARDDYFDTDQGYTGSGQFWVAYFANGASAAESCGGEHSTTGFCNSNTYMPEFTVANATYICINSDPNTILYKDDARVHYVNSIFYSAGSQIDYVESSTFLQRNLDSGYCSFKNNLFWGPDSIKFIFEEYPFTYWLSAKQIGGSLFKMCLSSMTINPKIAEKIGGLASIPAKSFDLRPADNSAARSNLYPLDSLNNPFLEKVNYRGAFDPSQDTAWWRGWTSLDFYGYLSQSDVKKLEPMVTTNKMKQSMMLTDTKSSKVCLSSRNLLTVEAVENAQVRIFSIHGSLLKNFPVNKGISSSSVTMIPGNYLVEVKGVRTSTTTLLNVMN